jgi:excisionase family DNA binding protein
MRKTTELSSSPDFGRSSRLKGPRLAYGIEDAADAVGLSRSRIYELIAAGEIAACKVGKRTIIPATELATFLDRHRVARLPDVRPGGAPRGALAQSQQRSKSEPRAE